MVLLPLKGVAGAEVSPGATPLAFHVPERSEPSRQQLWLMAAKGADMAQLPASAGACSGV